MKRKCFDDQDHVIVSFTQGNIRIAAGTIHENEQEVVVCRRCGLLLEDCQEPAAAEPIHIQDLPF
jgi:hypothetical protein